MSMLVARVDGVDESIIYIVLSFLTGESFHYKAK